MSRFGMSVIAGVTLGLAAMGGAASASPAPVDLSARSATVMSAVYNPAQPAARLNAQYVWGGQRYCWYGRGWHGAGWYRCGYGWRRGLGWGGGEGWRGWRYGEGPGSIPAGPYGGCPRGFHPGPAHRRCFPN